jgi:hypothetical protein
MILESITNKVRSTIAGRLNSAVSGAIRNGVSSLTGTTKEGANSTLGSIDVNGKYNTAMYSYPENVGNDAQQGHYIVFSINEFTQGKLESAKTNKSFSAADEKLKAEANLARTKIAAANPVESFSGINNQKPLRGEYKPKSLVAQKPKKRTGVVISLYMPPSVSVSYKVGYKDSEIGTLAMLGKNAVSAFASGGGTASALSSIMDDLSSTGAEGLKTAALGAIDVIAPGVKALVQLETGKVVTPKMEMMFENVGRRDFSFKFDFIPKSAAEAKTIERIIYSFKENMMPAFVEGSQREMKIPNTFDIEYMNQGVQNKFINKISTCFLTGIDVTYGGDRFTAYDPVDGSPPPQKSSISLSFSEIEIMNKELIKRGF